MRRFSCGSLSGKMACFWIAKYWRFVHNMPKTSVGKLDKNVGAI
jgi:acyl-CoA synthetase (AMP-forming)/AMP-acid ligase II